MKTFLFSDRDVWHFSIEAKTFRGALLKAKAIHGIAVGLRCIAYHGASRDYRASSTGYECSIREI